MKPFGHMDAVDIIFDYKSAAKKKEQVGILADLNATDKKTMAQWLADQGCEVDKRLLLPGRMKVTSAEDPVVSQADEVELTTPEPEAPEPVPSQTAKADAGKPRLTLVPRQIIWDIAAVRDYGNLKYGDPENWRQVEPERYRDALMRHLMAYLDDPKSVDSESGLPHLWHCACNISFLCELEKGGV